MDIMSFFGERLVELMFENKYTPDSLAKDVSIDVSVIRRYTRKETIPTLDNAIAIADCFSCSLNYLFGLSENSENVIYKTAPPFAQSFKKILTERGYSRYRLCKDANISNQRADDWFHGRRIPTVENAIKLTKFFDCSLDYLIGRE